MILLIFARLRNYLVRNSIYFFYEDFTEYMHMMFRMFWDRRNFFNCVILSMEFFFSLVFCHTADFKKNPVNFGLFFIIVNFQ